jgi:arginine/ornithine N-succinyltransferase beta subunit
MTVKPIGRYFFDGMSRKEREENLKAKRRLLVLAELEVERLSKSIAEWQGWINDSNEEGT